MPSNLRFLLLALCAWVACQREAPDWPSQCRILGEGDWERKICLRKESDSTVLLMVFAKGDSVTDSVLMPWPKSRPPGFQSEQEILDAMESYHGTKIELEASSWDIDAAKIEAGQPVSGQALFEYHCRSCHAQHDGFFYGQIGKSLYRPFQVRARDWLFAFIQDSDAMVEEGDMAALAAYEGCPDFASHHFELTAQQVDKIHDYILWVGEKSCVIAPSYREFRSR